MRDQRHGKFTSSQQQEIVKELEHLENFGKRKQLR
jgi:hypothetical protein